VAYAVAFTIFFFLGIVFMYGVLNSSQNPYGMGAAPDLRLVNIWFGYLLIFGAPALTMRLVSDEIRMGTMELLLTAPVRDSELIIGKWLGSMLFILSVLVVMLIYPIILNFMIVDPGIDQMTMMSSFLAMVLLASAFIGIGTGISAVFNNQIAAFFVTLLIFMSLWFLVGIPSFFLSSGGDFFRYMQFGDHYETMIGGTLNLIDVLYFVSLTVLGLFVGTTAVEMRRWR
jgi:ABC-2 type transport system permease protein